MTEILPPKSPRLEKRKYIPHAFTDDELASLKLGDIHLDAGKPYINLLGKGQKIRTAYLLPRAVALLKAYIKEVYGKSPGPEVLLFPAG